MTLRVEFNFSAWSFAYGWCGVVSSDAVKSRSWCPPYLLAPAISQCCDDEASRVKSSNSKAGARCQSSLVPYLGPTVSRGLKRRYKIPVLVPAVNSCSYHIAISQCRDITDGLVKSRTWYPLSNFARAIFRYCDVEVVSSRIANPEAGARRRFRSCHAAISRRRQPRVSP